MNIVVQIDENQIKQKVKNNQFGTFLAKTWKQLIDPYTPRDTGQMQDTAQIRPFEIYYGAPYSVYNYYGTGKTFQKNNPYSTDHWDVKAAGAGKQADLYRAANNYLGTS